MDRYGFGYVLFDVGRDYKLLPRSEPTPRLHQARSLMQVRDRADGPFDSSREATVEHANLLAGSLRESRLRLRGRTLGAAIWDRCGVLSSHDDRNRCRT